MNMKNQKTLRNGLIGTICCFFAMCILALPNLNVHAAFDTATVGVDNVISAGFYVSAAVREDGSLWVWGDGNLTPVKFMDDVKSVSIGFYHCAAVKKDGSLWTWGTKNVTNFMGELGNGTTEKSQTPQKIMDDVQCVALGVQSSAAIKTDGSLWVWGNAGSHRNNSYSSTPHKIMDNVKSVSLGGQFYAAVKNDGSLWVWGAFNDRPYPFEQDLSVGSDTPLKVMEHVKSVSIGFFYSAVIKEDGTLWVWGTNKFNNDITGMMGIGDATGSNTPIQILSGVKDVNASLYSGAAIKEDGSLWTWGNNIYGQLLDGTTNDSLTPHQVMSNVSKVSMGGVHTVVLKRDGSVLVGGYNEYGMVGNGTTDNQSTPVKIMYLGNSPASQSETKTYTVTFKNGSKTVKRQNVKAGGSATAPKLTKKGYTLSWNTSFSKVTKNLTVKAVWTPTLPKKGSQKKIGIYTYKVTKSAKTGGTVQLVKVSSKKQLRYTIPSSVKIGKYKFKVTGIQKNVFSNCKRAKRFSLPASITSIGKGAFKGISKNDQILVPKSKYKTMSRLLKKSGLNANVKIKQK